MQWLLSLLKSLLGDIVGELFKHWNRPDGVISGPVPVLEDIDLEDDPIPRLLAKYGVLDED